MEFLTEEQFEQNKVLHDKVLKWQEVPTKVIYRIESVEEISTIIGSAMVVNLVEKSGTRFKAFAISCLMKDLKDFSLGKGWFRNPGQSYEIYLRS